jgi:hypothetical protein
MKAISMNVHPASVGMALKITQKTARVAKLLKNMPMELMIKSARYCMRALIYWVSIIK